MQLMTNTSLLSAAQQQQHRLFQQQQQQQHLAAEVHAALHTASASSSSSSPSSSVSSSSLSSADDQPGLLSLPAKLDPHALPTLTLPPSPLHQQQSSSSSVQSTASAPASQQQHALAAASEYFPQHSPSSPSPLQYRGGGVYAGVGVLSSPSAQVLHVSGALQHAQSQPLPSVIGRAAAAATRPPVGPAPPSAAAGAPPPPFYASGAPTVSPFHPMQQQQYTAANALHPSASSMPYAYMHQQHQQHQQQQQQPQHQLGGNNGVAAPNATPQRSATAPSVHQQTGPGPGYSGFYAPSFGQGFPLLQQNYLQQQQQQQHTASAQQSALQHQHSLLKQQQMHQQQQQHQQQVQPSAAPFSPTSLQRLLNPSQLSQLGLSLPPAAFSAAQSAPAGALLSSELLYVNQRYHELMYKLQLHLRKLDEHHHHQHPVLIEDVFRALREELGSYQQHQLHRLSSVKPEQLLGSPQSPSLPSLSSVSPSYLSSPSSSLSSERLFCKPSRLISQFNKKPFKLLMVQIQRQYTSSKKELDAMREKEKERLIAVRVRLMGAPLRGHVYFVAKDLCQLIHSRKGNVAKSVSQFNENEKARMPVLCPRSNGTLSTHSLTVLTIDGIKRLLTASRSPLAPHLLKWLLGQVELIVEQGESGDEKVGNTTTVTFPRVERKGEVEVKEGEFAHDVQLLVDSDEEGGDDDQQQQQQQQDTTAEEEEESARD